jgi:integrase
MKELVRLNKRPSSDDSSFTYVLRYTDECGKRRWDTLGHSDRRKAEKQRALKEKELRMGYIQPDSMNLRDFLKDSLARTGDQIRESTREEYESAMNDFIKTVGNIDYQSVTLGHGEYYRQACLDKGNTPATVVKKLREVKVIFQAAVARRQLDENPLKYIKMPKQSQSKINTYDNGECERIVKVAMDFIQGRDEKTNVKWDLLILVTLATAMRRGELLNCVWDDIDFEKQTIEVSPKEDTNETWTWLIKDTDSRTLPLTDELTKLLIDHQTRQPDGYPYVFVPPARYDWIQQRLRSQGKWTYADSRLTVVRNFDKQFNLILDRAHVKKGTFHDLRKTAICNWLVEGLREYEVMRLAGHSDFRTTHKYYLAVADNLKERAREVTARGLCQKLVQIGATGCLASKSA